VLECVIKLQIFAHAIRTHETIFLDRARDYELIKKSLDMISFPGNNKKNMSLADPTTTQPERKGKTGK